MGRLCPFKVKLIAQDRPQAGGYSSFSFGAVSGDQGLVLYSDATIRSPHSRKSWENAATSSPWCCGANGDRFRSASRNKRTAGDKRLLCFACRGYSKCF